MFRSPTAFSLRLPMLLLSTTAAAPHDPPCLDFTPSLPSLSPFAVALAESAHLHDSTRFRLPLFSYSYVLPCTLKNHNSFIFKRFRTLCAKHPGVGYPRQNKSQASVRAIYSTPAGQTPCQLPPSCIDSSDTMARLPKAIHERRQEMSGDKSNQGGDRFPLTRWSVIGAARSGDEAERVRAMDTLCAAYWKPVYKYVRLRWNRRIEDAQDLTQGFFVQVIERELLDKFDPAKSRLRTYLRVCADSFVINEEKAAKRLKRGGNVLHVALDFAGAEEELVGAAMDPAAIPSPESLEEFFEKEWVRGLFELAVEDLRKHCEANERDRTFRLFEEYDLAGDETISYDQLAAEYAIPVTDVTNALAWARREFRRGALERLGDVCGSEEEFQREARSLFGWEAK